MILPAEKQHSLIMSGSLLGFEGYRNLKDMFCVHANGDNNFLLYGIAENSLLIVDPKKPFRKNGLNVFETDTIINGEKQLKLSLTRLDGCPFMGRVIMSVSQFS